MHPTDKSARIAGAVYLSMVFTAPFSLIYVPSKLIVPSGRVIELPADASYDYVEVAGTLRVSRANIRSILSMFNRGKLVPSNMLFNPRIPSRLALTVVNG